jgi:hypothetical protein
MKGNDMKSTDPKVTDPALAVIRKYDSSIYDQIQKADWSVEVIADPFITWFGATSRDGSESAINLFNVLEASQRLRVPPTDFLANVLVHEYRHTLPDAVKPGAKSEEVAFRYDLAFAEKMPASDSPIVRQILADMREEVADNRDAGLP